MIFLCYPKCTTCQKAKKWLDNGAQPTETVKSILTKNGLIK